MGPDPEGTGRLSLDRCYCSGVSIEQRNARALSLVTGNPFLIAGVVVACFVAFNIGGATTGPAFGPAVGASVLSETAAGVLMAVAFFVGAYTIGRRVVDTLGQELVHDPSVFTLEASIIVLFFIGGALLIGNLSGAPASTSMTAVGAIIGLGLAGGELNLAVVGKILAWWILSPIIGFWLAVMIGRYGYGALDQLLAIEQSEGPLLVFERVEVGVRPVVRPDELKVVGLEPRNGGPSHDWPPDGLQFRDQQHCERHRAPGRKGRPRHECGDLHRLWGRGRGRRDPVCP